jgi:hypothetical protein
VVDEVVELSGAKATAAYLLAVRPVLHQAIVGREAWVRSIGVLMEDARKDHRAVVMRDAARIARERLAQFRECRERLAGLWPPSGCVPCHGWASSWLDELIAVCQLLEDIGRTGDLARLRHVDNMLSESRIDARRFNAEYARLSDELRTVVAEAHAARPRNVVTMMRPALAS